MISVITPTYNRAHLLPRVMQSLLRQTCDQWEWVVVDDGSTDNTSRIVAGWAAENARIRLVTEANTGLALARNAGIAAAKGRYLTFLDSDDEYEPTHLELRRTMLEVSPDIDLLHGGLRIVGGSEFVPDRENPHKQIAISDCYVGGTFFMRAKVARELGGFRRPDFGDDFDFMTRALARFKVRRVDFPTYIYHRETPDSMCNVESARRTIN